MVEAMVSFAIERIADVLVREASLLHGVRDEVQQLQTELRGIRCFLKDADSKQDQDERVRNWVAEIRDIAYEAEDVIDTFLLLRAETGSRKRVCGLIKKITSMFTKVPNLHEIGTQIKSIQAKIVSVSANTQKLGIKLDAEGEGSKSRSEMQTRLRRSYPHDQEDDVISLEATIRDVKSQLLMMEEQGLVVALVGMGGLGKTTLAKKIYNDIHVRQHFDCHSWSFLSQQFSTRDVLVGILMEVASKQDKFELVKLEEEKLLQSRLERVEYEVDRMEEQELSKLMSKQKKRMKEEQLSESMFKSMLKQEKRIEEEQLFRSMMKQMKVEPMFNSMLERMREEKLVETLFEVLKRKRYLVVLDDIWKNEAWDSLKHAFPSKGKEGSKVLLTTRNKEVVSYADPWSFPVEPPLLTNDEAWELLSRKAFPKAILIKHGYSLRHEELGREMVKKCGGLPLAVVVLGGLLATKKTLMEWEAVHRNINAQFVKWEQNHQYGGVYGILALSYLDMPFYLKPFFLYFSQFPEDWEIHKRVLIRMWIAEGFVPRVEREGEETMEDVGEQYLEELVGRCMIQVSQRDHTGIGIKTCRVHDLMRDMCILKAREENFLGIFEHYRKNIVARRIAIHPEISPEFAGQCSVPLQQGSNRGLRSVSYFLEEQRYWLTVDQRNLIFKDSRMLRVLNLKGVYIGNLPNEIGDLIHLRYLGLRKTELSSETSLPMSIGKLRSLYTLDVRDNQLGRLPDVVWTLEDLRHLLIDLHNILGHCQMDTLRNLETLRWTHCENLVRKNAMQNLTNLRNLAIDFRRREEIDGVMKSPIFSTGRLRSLNIQGKQSSFPNLEPLSRCQCLTKLELNGIIPEYPESLNHNLGYLPASITKLILSNSRLMQDPMIFLEKLPNLRFLYLEENSYKGTKMLCSAQGFPQLEILKLEFLTVLKEWEIEKGAMPCLKILHLEKLRELKMIPEGLKFVTNLEELKVVNMTETFAKRIRVINGVEGEDFEKVRHIPSISA
ncbi:hypothetical protein P3X46_014298 [Hevea brasiliensis]|uniref:Uncharacterized protein n=1 Tax=Hevea brasiliensis TaxID=3981 RepID=A0ABQ9M8J7_HEVBR|nr:putative disease resistance protein At1g50180 [Hevea brasiliensis]KAJ9175782.1 hypothetical protein P3X46_014298 [Hevea brasiliensis]